MPSARVSQLRQATNASQTAKVIRKPGWLINLYERTEGMRQHDAAVVSQSQLSGQAQSQQSSQSYASVQYHLINYLAMLYRIKWCLGLLMFMMTNRKRSRPFKQEDLYNLVEFYALVTPDGPERRQGVTIYRELLESNHVSDTCLLLARNGH